MKKYISLLILFSSFIFQSCTAQSSSVTVKGIIKDFKGKTVYAKQINPFSYQSNSLLDSTKVDENGAFEFRLNVSLPILINFSKNNKQHPVHQVLQNAPENYYFGYCAMFYLQEPTMYLEEASTINLDWTVKNLSDSFSFKNLSYDYQNKFYNYYIDEGLGELLYDGSELKQMKKEEAWSLIDIFINKTLEKHNIEKNEQNDKFDNYLYTEIKLGAINVFITWYEKIYQDELELAFPSGNLPDSYTKAFSIYSDNEWNHQSVEFYKMTERFVTFNMNKSRKEFNTYYSPNKEKKTIAKKALQPTTFEKYTADF